MGYRPTKRQGENAADGKFAETRLVGELPENLRCD